MKLCGCNEECFIPGKCWGHLEGVMCHHLSEKKIDGEIRSICFKDGSVVDDYTTKNNYDKLIKKKMDQEKEEIENALLEAVWVMRWTDNHQAMYAVLTPEEAEQMCKDILMELETAGYKIVKK